MHHHRQAVGSLITKAGMSRFQAGLAIGLPETSSHSSMHDYIERTRTWPEGMLARLVDVLRPHLIESGMTEAEIDAEVDNIRAGFAAELDERLEARRGAAIPIGP